MTVRKSTIQLCKELQDIRLRNGCITCSHLLTVMLCIKMRFVYEFLNIINHISQFSFSFELDIFKNPSSEICMIIFSCEFSFRQQHIPHSVIHFTCVCLNVCVEDIWRSRVFLTMCSCFECHLGLMHYPSNPLAIWSGLSFLCVGVPACVCAVLWHS